MMVLVKDRIRRLSQQRQFALMNLLVLLSNVMLLASGTSLAAVSITTEPVVTGLTNPVAITHAGDGSDRLFITLQTGQIVIYDSAQVLAAPFLDISGLVSSGGERGLLGVAFHRSYASNGFFYVNYTDAAGDTVIARYSVSADPNLADPTSAFILLTIPQPFSNHNGGQLQFGPDGYLYVAVGDGGSGGDPQDNAQNLGSFLGKILRIDVDGGVPYAIPADNPFVGIAGALDEIWASGLRNPWRFSFDRLTDDLFIGDVGQGIWEEVDFQPTGSAGGENYGWRLMEGNSCFNPSTNCNNGTLTLPILVYDHNVGCSITGGYRYRGSNNPDLDGFYVYGDYCTGRIWGAKEDGMGGWTATELIDTNFLISTFGEDESGEIYVAHFSSTDGAIYQIVQTNSAPSAPASLDEGGGGGGAGVCFIATAAYGSQVEPQVQILRKFRDRFLLNNSVGRTVLHFYYTRLAKVLEEINARPGQ
jgi:glucose/arabinose dehydrogenase